MTNFILLSCFTLTYNEGIFREKPSPHDCSCSMANRTTPSLSTHTIPPSPETNSLLSFTSLEAPWISIALPPTG